MTGIYYFLIYYAVGLALFTLYPIYESGYLTLRNVVSAVILAIFWPVPAFFLFYDSKMMDIKLWKRKNLK